MGGCRGKLGRPRCRPRWDTHLNSRSLLNWNSSLAATAAGSVKKCTNGQTKVIWLPFSGSHKKSYGLRYRLPTHWSYFTGKILVNFFGSGSAGSGSDRCGSESCLQIYRFHISGGAASTMRAKSYVT